MPLSIQPANPSLFLVLVAMHTHTVVAEALENTDLEARKVVAVGRRAVATLLVEPVLPGWAEK